jgi:hypothetical protein
MEKIIEWDALYYVFYMHVRFRSQMEVGLMASRFGRVTRGTHWIGSHVFMAYCLIN